MSLFDKWFNEDEKIAEELHGFLPDEREDYLLHTYGRAKEEFPWVDFGDDHADRSMDEDSDDKFDDDRDDDFDEDDDDFDEDSDEYDSDDIDVDSDLW